ncbi:MAG: TfoX/Sxy family protein [Candidatus Sabulitectum sp.]|nr:TfoX/Sxy family protein [Candidatus Sabulitectum sp.]
MAISDEFLCYVLDQFSELGVTYRKMFGGAGLYHQGKVFGLIADDVVYLKVDDSNRKNYMDAGSPQFKPFPDKDMFMPYYEIPSSVLEDPDELCEWALESLQIPSYVRQKGIRKRNEE